jgi:peptidyl-prolyl cis-trans isomerase SurA
MKKIFVFIFFAIALYGLTGKAFAQDEVVAKIAGEPITLRDFEIQYLKSVADLSLIEKLTMKDKADYLNLLVRYKLKVKDARDRGLINNPETQKEIEDFRKNYLIAFLVDRKITEPFVEKLYEKKKVEVRASHILINLVSPFSPEDSIRAYEKANIVIARLNAGEDFSSLARELSDDPSAYKNGGDLYYFTGGMTVPEFEEIVYSLNTGEYNKEPVRSMFGLHIVKLTDKKPRVHSVRASHILIMDKKDSLGKITDSIGAYTKSLEILNQLKNGGDFYKLAVENSEDPGSAQKGGDLGFFERRRMVQQFDSVAFSLKPGEMSDIVRTPFGFHIIKVTDIKQLPPFEKEKDELKNEYKRGTLFKNEYNAYVKNVKQNYNFSINEAGVDFLMSRFDTNIVFSKTNFDSLFSPAENDMTLASFDGGKVTLESFRNLLQIARDYSLLYPFEANIRKVIDEAATLPLLSKFAEDSGIENDEDYRKSFKEYENGLLIFRIDMEELNSKVNITEDEVKFYYDSNQQQYVTSGDGGTKVKPLDEVRSEIINILQPVKFKDVENEYILELMKKYPVELFESELERAFLNFKTEENEEESE